MRTRRPVGEAGYNMVILVIAVTVLNILLALALPKWSYLIQRDKEEELRSRGLQYAEALRVYQMRFGGQPTQLDQLVKVKPRSIRRLYTDPMTEKGEWGIIFAGMANPGQIDPNDPNAPPQGQLPPGEENPQNPGTTFSLPSQLAGGGLGPNGQPVAVGPILGVHSLSKEQSLSSFFGASTYDRWLFTADLLQRTGGARPGTEAHFPRFDLKNLGRPFRDGLDPLLNQAPGVVAGALPQGPGGGAMPGLPPGVGQGRRPGAGIPGFGGQQPGFGGQQPQGGVPGAGTPPRRGTGGRPGAGGTGGAGGEDGGFGGQPGFPGFPGQPGFPGSGGNGGSGGNAGNGGSGGSGGPGGNGGGSGGPPPGTDPTLPNNGSALRVLTPPSQ